MRAFDEFRRREGYPDADASYQTTELIIQKRLEIYDRETEWLHADWGDPAGSYRPYYGAPSARPPYNVYGTSPFRTNELSGFRVLKQELFQLVYDRYVQFGPASLPKWFGSAGNERRQTIFDWWEQWEHIEPLTDPAPTVDFHFLEMSLPGRPFDQQKIWDPTNGLTVEPFPPRGRLYLSSSKTT